MPQGISSTSLDGARSRRTLVARQARQGHGRGERPPGRSRPARGDRAFTELRRMPARAIIFHGTGGHPSYCWYPWLGAKLEARGYEVEIPHYPSLNQEPIETFLPTVLGRHVFD